MNVIPIHPMPTLPLDRRNLTAEVEIGFEEPAALKEASRCYLCHYKFEIVDAKCVLCDECLKVKPVPGCIVEVAALMQDDAGRVTGYRRVEPGGTDSLYYNRLWIDQNQCVRCGQCEAVCPVNAITIQKVSLGTATFREALTKSRIRDRSTFVPCAVSAFKALPASLSAAMRLCGFAFPVPAMPSAVPWSGEVRMKGRPRVTLTPP